jgi:hypothetical protein
LKGYLLFAFLLVCGTGFSQDELSKEEQERREKNIEAGNPFARFGYKAKVATLSKGKYLEFHDLDSIVTIGSVRFNVYKSQIVGHIVQDTLNPDAQPIGDVTGRWMSPDPLSSEYPNWSPYSFTANTPINLIDPDGREPIDPRTGKPISLNLYRAAVYDDNHIKNTNNKIVRDNDLFNRTNTKYVPRSRNSPDAQWDGAAIHKHESNFEHTSKGAFGALKKLFPNNNNIDSSFDAPSDGIWNSVSKQGTYTFLDDRYSESEYFFVNQSEYNITRTEKYRTLNVTETTQKYSNNSPSGKSSSKSYTREEIIK